MTNNQMLKANVEFVETFGQKNSRLW